MDCASYVLPAVRGTQAQREYYISMVPLDVMSKIFQFADEDLPPEIRAQRILNKSRIPEIRDYILSNPDSYVFSALTVSVDGNMEFMPADETMLQVGTISISMTSRFLINDGQHRRAAIAEAIKMNPSLKNEHISVVFYRDEGLLRAQNHESIAVHCVMDNEEVGSGTKQGAASTFLKDTLLRINMGLGRTYEEYLMTLAGSFMVSADNAHALHPNYTDKTDPTNHPVLNKGIVIKFNANQKYCTDAVSAALFKELCTKAGVPYQTFVNRSDIAGGSTLGNISNTQVPMNTVDIGLPQLAMHSPSETAGVKDTEYLVRAAEELFA